MQVNWQGKSRYMYFQDGPPPSSLARAQGSQGEHIAIDCGEQRRNAVEHGDLVLDEERGEPVTEAPESVGPATSVAPAIHVGQISSKEKSKAIVMPW